MDQKNITQKTKQHKFIVSNHKQDLLYNFTKLIWSQGLTIMDRISIHI